MPNRPRIGELQVCGRRKAQATEHASRRGDDRTRDVGPDDVAAVREGGVGDGELERRDGEVALTDREVDGVALVPDPLGRIVECPSQPGGCGDDAARLSRQVESCRVSEPEPQRPVLQVERSGCRLARVELGAEPVEPGVAGDRERLVEVQVGVDRGLDVVKDDVADGERTGAGQNRPWRDQSGRKGRFGRDRLEGRTGRIEPLGRAVEKRHHRIARGEQAREIARVVRSGGLVVVRRARERVDRAVPRIHNDRGTGVSVGVARPMREGDPVDDRTLRHTL